MNSIKSKLKNYLFHGLVYGFGSAFDAIVGFLVLPLYTIYFSTEEYGIFSFLILLSTFASSIFYLGDTQSSLIFFLILIFLLFLFSAGISFKLFYDKFNFIWFVAFLATLIAVVPAINVISTRLIFFPIFFLFIFFLKVIFYQHNLNKKFKLKNLIFYFLIILLIVATILIK